MLSHDGETWWRDCYGDTGVATAKTVYMHNDKDYDIMKVLVYLSDVNESRGPFCFVRGSHKWGRSRTQSFFFKAFDAAANRILAPLEPVRTVYYRKVFRHPAFREQFLKLPRRAARFEPFRRRRARRFRAFRMVTCPRDGRDFGRRQLHGLYRG